jgi:CBS domain-containing protein
VTAFEEVTTALRSRPGGPPREERIHAVRRAVSDQALSRDESILYEQLAPVRDSLVHDRHEGRPLVQPTGEAIRAIEGIRAGLTGTEPTVWPFCRPVTTVEPSTTVATACRLMRDRDYSTLPVVSHDGIHGLLSATDVVWWVGGALDDILLLEDVPVTEVMHAHTTVDYVLVGRGSLQRDVPRLFSSSGASGCPIGAVLITSSGRPHEKLVGIITPWDLADLG